MRGSSRLLLQHREVAAWTPPTPNHLVNCALGYGDGVFRRRLRFSAAAGSGLLIAALAAVPASIAAPVADDPVVNVSIDTFTPATPKPGQPVTITGQVTNT